jgi:hypothetical protein
MDPKTSTDYDVDNRYSGGRNATDNTAGKQFLNRFLRSQKSVGVTSIGTIQPRDLTAQRGEDDHFIVGAMGGTVPIGSLNLGQQIKTTDSVFRFKNAFNAPNSPSQRRMARMGQ